MNHIKMNLNWKLCAGFNSLCVWTSGRLLGTPQLTVTSINFEFRILGTVRSVKYFVKACVVAGLTESAFG